MKRFLIGAAVVALVVGAVACKKCVNCHYDYIYLGDTVTVQFTEECGKSGYIEDYKAEKNAEANRYGVELVCEDSK